MNQIIAIVIIVIVIALMYLIIDGTMCKAIDICTSNQTEEYSKMPPEPMCSRVYRECSNTTARCVVLETNETVKIDIRCEIWNACFGDVNVIYYTTKGIVSSGKSITIQDSQGIYRKMECQRN